MTPDGDSGHCPCAEPKLGGHGVELPVERGRRRSERRLPQTSLRFRRGSAHCIAQCGSAQRDRPFWARNTRPATRSANRVEAACAIVRSDEQRATGERRLALPQRCQRRTRCGVAVCRPSRNRYSFSPSRAAARAATSSWPSRVIAVQLDDGHWGLARFECGDHRCRRSVVVGRP